MSKPFLFLLFFALAIRLAWIAFLPWSGPRLYPFVDADGYLNAAESFRTGQFLDNGEQIVRMPLYPSLLSFITRAVRPAPLSDANASALFVIRSWHCLLDVVTLACLYLFVNKWFAPGCALPAGILYAIYPLALYRLPLPNTEIIQGAAMAFWLLAASKVLETRRLRDALGLSLLSAVQAFISPALQFVPFLFSICLFLIVPWKNAVRLCAVLIIPFLLISSAWGLRNAAVSGQFFLYDIRGGKEFWLGNNQDVDGRWEGPGQTLWMSQWKKIIEETKAEGGGAREINRRLYAKGLEEILSNPSGAALLFVKKFFRFWYVPASERMLSVTIPLQTLYLILALMGFAAAGYRHSGILLILGVIGYLCAIYTLSYACIRFSQPLMPWVCALGGVGLHRIRCGRMERTP